jgi:outer membrane receptor for Fe3+-dicitrate
MRTHGHVIPLKAASALGLTLLALAFGVHSLHAAYYQPGQVVTNFTLYARPSWTNSAGFPEDAPMRLSDFAGKIIFVEFFDPT